jgi:hypothetical protein
LHRPENGVKHLTSYLALGVQAVDPSNSLGDGEERTTKAAERLRGQANHFGLVLRYLAGRCKQSGFAFVLKPEAFATDVDDNRVVQDTIEHRRSEHAVAGESGIPTAEGKIRSEDQ